MEELTEADLVDLSPGLGRQVIEVVDTMMSRLEGLEAALGGAKPQGPMDMGCGQESGRPKACAMRDRWSWLTSDSGSIGIFMPWLVSVVRMASLSAR